MRKLFLFILMAVLPLFAQERSFFDSPFGVGYGYIGGYLAPQSNELFDKLGLTELDKGMYMNGGGGFVYINFIRGLRVGVFTYSGTKTQTPSNSLELKYEANSTSLTVEYTLPFVREIGLSPGVGIGFGSFSVDRFDGNAKIDYSDLSAMPSNKIFQSTLKSNYWTFSTSFNVDYMLYRFINLRLGFGYNFNFGNSYKINNDVTLNNVPKLNNNAYFIQAGVLIGFFNF